MHPMSSLQIQFALMVANRLKIQTLDDIKKFGGGCCHGYSQGGWVLILALMDFDCQLNSQSTPLATV